jgi:microcystin-dependent protein
LFAGTFAPQDWALCNGALLPISGYDALFNLIGTTYGGDGVSTFGLPSLASRVPVHQGTSNTGTYVIGQLAGVENVTISEPNMPRHTHVLACTGNTGQVASPANALPAVVNSTQTNVYVYGTGGGKLTTLMPATVGISGGSVPHNNIQPYLCATFIISLFGIYPSQG